MKRTFASDNYSGVHPDIFAALQRANQGHTPSYGADEYTARATALFRQHFTPDTEVFFAYNGTGANVIGLSAITHSFEAIICSDLAHINVDESTAPEKFLGCKLVTIPTDDGKIYPHDVEHRIQRVDDQHHPQARVISISQSTEYGTVYSVEEVKALAAVARKHNLYLHMDGSRLSNAAVSLDRSFREFTVDAGVDVLSFGGTKNGLMFGEAVLFFNPALAKHFRYIRKQGMQLHSKMRFIGAQFEALLSGDLWKRNAGHANAMARLLEEALRSIPGVTITRPVQANGIFATLPPAIIPALQEEIYFYVWNEKTSEIRLMCSFDTQEEDVRHFSASIRRLIGAIA
ncbi:threonine aldolase family protein [Dawidia soli]|uniref:Low specificity L-threonine aldolase n=1 Tax=Dawidia soli TaxID=2782352 RepID=A0AAP2GEC6_9BACT|nr:low specificity L-threonine aldolase [Dawidia soli]MBT1688222.1 low specificity L-threonine aldolase [Dawidia soli]